MNYPCVTLIGHLCECEGKRLKTSIKNDLGPVSEMKFYLCFRPLYFPYIVCRGTRPPLVRPIELQYIAAHHPLFKGATWFDILSNGSDIQSFLSVF